MRRARYSSKDRRHRHLLGGAHSSTVTAAPRQCGTTCKWLLLDADSGVNTDEDVGADDADANVGVGAGVEASVSKGV